MNLLIVEDEETLSDSLKRGLTEAGYSVSVTHDGDTALNLVNTNQFDLLILDWRLPKKSGIEVTKQLRIDGNDILILMLTAMDDVESRVLGLETGADDYLTKPFSFQELLARIHALFRRSIVHAQTTYMIDDLILDTLTRTVRRGDNKIILTTKEYALLEYFMRNIGTVLSRAQIAEHVWNISFDTGTNLIDVYVNYIRQKLDTGNRRQLIHSVYKVGYVMKLPDNGF